MPNLASVQARLGRDRWYHLDVPRHRTHFTPDGLGTAARTRGFEVLAVRHRLLEHNPYGMWQSAVSRLTRHPSYLYNLLKRNAPLDPRDLALTALAVPLAPAAALAELLAGMARRGGTIAVLARRRAEIPSRVPHPAPLPSEGMEGSGGFGDLFGDPEDLQRRLGEFAEQMQGAQRLAWADNAIKLAVDLTVAAINRANIQGTTEQQAEQLRAVMAVIFPEAVTLVREAREGLQ